MTLTYETGIPGSVQQYRHCHVSCIVQRFSCHVNSERFILKARTSAQAVVCLLYTADDSFIGIGDAECTEHIDLRIHEQCLEYPEAMLIHNKHIIDESDTATYLGHILCNCGKDYKDIMRQCQQLYARGNVLLGKFRLNFTCVL